MLGHARQRPASILDSNSGYPEDQFNFGEKHEVNKDKKFSLKASKMPTH